MKLPLVAVPVWSGPKYFAYKILRVLEGEGVPMTNPSHRIFDEQHRRIQFDHLDQLRDQTRRVGEVRT
jgi:hypothetical protein